MALLALGILALLAFGTLALQALGTLALLALWDVESLNERQLAEKEFLFPLPLKPPFPLKTVQIGLEMNNCL